MAHADWLLRGPGKSVLALQALWEGNIRILTDLENFWTDLDENKRIIGIFLWENSNNNTFWNIAFFESRLFYKQGNWMPNGCKYEAKPRSSEVR